MADAVLSFPPFLLDPHRKSLKRGKRDLDLTPKDFALLYYLGTHADRMVSHDELLQHVWAGVTVTQGVIKVCIRRIRQALNDSVQKPQYIESSRGEGYRLIAPVTVLPLGNEHEAETEEPHAPPVVGRERELAQLQHWFMRALQGRRQIVFVTGEPGIGKTTLVRTFVKQLAASGGAVIGRGQCIEQYGAGEAYLPVLEALGRLCRAPGGTQLVRLMEQYAPTWLSQLPAIAPLVDLSALRQKLHDTTRERMLREMTEGIEVLTANRPFVLLLEDLHWSDYSTLELIATLARRQENAKLLVIGTYRQGEMQKNDHPFNRVIPDLAAHRLSERLALSLLPEGQVTQYLQERFSPNTFPFGFGQMLHRRTEGNPLFFTNLVEDWISRGLVVQDTQGWTLQAEVSVLEREVPESIRSLITEQSQRLLPEEQQGVQAASLVGSECSSAAVAAALGEEALEAEEWCAGLANRHLFLHSDGVSEWPDGTIAGRYQFLHALYQQVWTEQVNVLQRQHLHQRIGERKEAAYGDGAKAIAAELAIHFEEGRDYQRAVQYRHSAAESAIQRGAHHEAETHLKNSLELLKRLPETPKRTQQELVLRTTLALTLQAIRGYGNAEVEQAYIDARALVGKVRGRAQLFRMLFGLWQLHVVRAEYETALELGQQLLGLAEDEQDTGLLVEAHAALGVTIFHRGELQTALTHLNRSTTLYDRAQHRLHTAVYGQDPWVACQSYVGVALWLLGYAQQAVQRTSEALRYAQEIAHPFSHAFALHDVVLVYQFQRDLPAARQHAEALLTLAREHTTSLLGIRSGRFVRLGVSGTGARRSGSGYSPSRGRGQAGYRSGVAHSILSSTLGRSVWQESATRGGAGADRKSVGGHRQNWGTVVGSGNVSAEGRADAATVQGKS